ncbi:MAG: endolytic transglycosylase MltG [Candidatus Paceibacterota bacterium]
MKTLIKLLSLGIIVFLLWLPYAVFNFGPVANDPKIHEFSIEKGSSLDEIATHLEDQGLIRSKKFFKLYSVLKGTAHQLKPGLYLISKANSVKEITEKFISGPDNEVTFLIQEGKTVDQIDERLAEFGLIKRGQIKEFPIKDLVGDFPFLEGRTSLEGYLFPDTYQLSPALLPEEILQRFLGNFEEKALPMLAEAKAPYDALIIASMIEKEVPHIEDRKLVSGVIQNRLEIGMGLQLDATLIYAKDYGEAYDTYQFAGLPPTPIANPGLEAIEAALNPTPSNYFYYLSQPETGETLFSETFDEHDTKRAEHLR